VQKVLLSSALSGAKSAETEAVGMGGAHDTILTIVVVTHTVRWDPEALVSSLLESECVAQSSQASSQATSALLVTLDNEMKQPCGPDMKIRVLQASHGVSPTIHLSSSTSLSSPRLPRPLSFSDEQQIPSPNILTVSTHTPALHISTIPHPRHQHPTIFPHGLHIIC
jgi:hypothetical protein